MKIGLKEFQEEAVENLLKNLSKAKREVREGGLQSVVLSSPTGSGKTIITAALIEAILEGTDEISFEKDAVFLWFSDQPELNEQSRKKVFDATDRLRGNDLVVVDSSFDEEVFEGGKLYFINSQKLGKDKLLTTKGDNRSYTIWETINNTSQQLGDKFYLIIDEAHRGMNQSAREELFSRTIIQKLILGDNDLGISPVSMVLGLSATPNRFLRLMEGVQHTSVQRITRVVQIDPEDVRSSGLLKDKIILYHPDSEYPTDWTLLSSAVKKWENIKSEWEIYTESQGIDSINPAMIIQVEDRSDTHITKTDLELVIKTLESEIGPIDDEELAHCFEEDIDIPVGAKTIRKIEASKIQDDTKVKFVFFKMSLTTGWDCPRAEVMMSFRTAKDHTLIAQLVGRMVRTPLARRIEGQELLNSVSLYLPYYDSEGLEEVINFLKSDSDSVPPTEVEKGNNQAVYYRRKNSDYLFRQLNQLPTYHLEKTRKVSNIRRLIKLSRLLTSFHDIDEEALDNSKDLIIDTIHSFKKELASKNLSFNKKVNEAKEITINPVVVEQGIWMRIPGEPIRVTLTSENIEELFVRCGKRLGEGLHLDYWKKYYNQSNPEKPKLELFLTLQEKEVFDTLEKACGERIDTLFRTHKDDIRKLKTSEIEKYNQIREQARVPEAISFISPTQIMVNLDITNPKIGSYEKHLYVDEEDKFLTVLGSDWERETIQAEIEKDQTVGWLRNYDRKSWSLCVPYENQGKSTAMYPDFLVIRQQDGEFIVDILEPHRDDLEDNWKKAIGLAKFSEKHWTSFGRIELIRRQGNSLKRLDINNDVVREKILEVTSNAHLTTIFNIMAI
ncbi:DEAD/DEAH box helicase [Exiguobacterium sp. SH3S2]|uniref:DEAD/DEAH box helicase n=1 Tax=Exiguobacterium sp. SH3S2 TaxID=2510956 RepID=UPI001375A552|nr:DEAD/DEAH box helicase family protein [Exiguobacterium sp. SH3S2]